MSEKLHPGWQSLPWGEQEKIECGKCGEAITFYLFKEEDGEILCARCKEKGRYHDRPDVH